MISSLFFAVLIGLSSHAEDSIERINKKCRLAANKVESSQNCISIIDELNKQLSETQRELVRNSMPPNCQQKGASNLQLCQVLYVETQILVRDADKFSLCKNNSTTVVACLEKEGGKKRLFEYIKVKTAQDIVAGSKPTGPENPVPTSNGNAVPTR